MAIAGFFSSSLAHEPQFDGHRHEVLLGAVVEVAFDLAPAGVGRSDDAGSGFLELVGLPPHLLERRLERGVQLDVVEGHTDLAGQLGHYLLVVGVPLLALAGAGDDQPEQLTAVGDRREP